MEYMASIYEKTNDGEFFRGHKVIAATSVEEAMKKAELPEDLREIATVRVTQIRKTAH